MAGKKKIADISEVETAITEAIETAEELASTESKTPEIKEKKPESKKEVRYSNNDLYELVVEMRDIVMKEENLRRRDARPGVVTKENAASIQGLRVMLDRAVATFRNYTRPSKAI